MALHKYHSLIKSWLYITPIILRIYGVYKNHEKLDYGFYMLPIS